MKKTIAGLMILLVSAAGINASAAPKDKKGDRKCDRSECPEKKGQCPGVQCPNPFEGLNLTAEQQQKIDALRTQCHQQRAQKADQKRQEATQRKAAKKQARVAQRREMLAQIKAILTPEQYTQFLENSFVNGAQPKAKGPKGKGSKCDRGPRPGGEQCPVAGK